MRCYRSLPLRLDRRKRGSSIEESRVRESVSGHRCPAFLWALPFLSTALVVSFFLQQVAFVGVLCRVDSTMTISI